MDKISISPEVFGDILKRQTHLKVTSLYKDLLEILEDVKTDNPSIPPEVFIKYRKKILDKGNEASRELIDAIDKFDIIPKNR